MNTFLKLENKVHFYVELPKVFYSNAKVICCSGFINSKIKFTSVALILNDKIIVQSKMLPHFYTENGSLKKCAFLLSTELQDIFKFENIKFALQFSNKNETYIHKLESVFIEKNPKKIETKSKTKVAVCLPLYNPNIKSFEKQLKSIVNQTYKNIQIIIQDDFSDLENKSEIKQLLKNYPDIIFLENESNLGFYNNIESLLYKIGNSFEYICFSDQDDFWQMEKIAKQVESLEKNKVNLVYSDLKIVNENNEILSESFWKNRSNHINNFKALVLNNVATGSTILLKTEWLKTILPFPQQIGKVYHDHWICAKTKLKGKTFYIDEPLVNYIQHQNNVTGFHQFEKHRFSKRLLNLLSLTIVSCKVIFKKDISNLQDLLLTNHRIYFTNVQRIKLFYSKLGFKSSDLKTMFNMIFLSLQTLYKNYQFNQTEVAIYTSIVYNFAIKIRYFLKFKNEQ